MRRYQESHPGLPMVMGGVSMGGMAATLTVMRSQEMWKVGMPLMLNPGCKLAQLMKDLASPVIQGVALTCSC